MEDCLFCRFASGEIRPDVVFEDEQVLAFRDINPQAPVHVLVIPKRHVGDVGQLGAGDGATLEAVFGAVAAVAAAEGLSERGFRVVANTGAEAGQTVLHVHFHVLGGRAMSWPPG